MNAKRAHTDVSLMYAESLARLKVAIQRGKNLAGEGLEVCCHGTEAVEACGVEMKCNANVVVVEGEKHALCLLSQTCRLSSLAFHLTRGTASVLRMINCSLALVNQGLPNTCWHRSAHVF